jgi:hypothetical protein
MGYELLNYFFIAFHTALILFNSLGWAFYKTRKLNLLTLSLTFCSWFILGIWYGWGYCVCTDWHWQVRDKLGYHDTERSYIQFLFSKLLSIDLDVKTADTLAVVVFFASLAMSVFLNLRDRQKLRGSRRA